MKWFILIFGLVANAFASILVKMAMLPPRKFPSLVDPMAAVGNWPFWLGLVMYGITFLLYAASLAKLPLNVVHPVLTSGSIVIVSIFSLLILHESFHWTTGVGILFVVVGVGLITAY